MIKRVVVYETKGRQFHTVRDAIAHREDLVEEFLRKTPGFTDLPMRSRVAFVQSILESRNELIDLLTYSAPEEEQA